MRRQTINLVGLALLWPCPCRAQSPRPTTSFPSPPSTNSSVPSGTPSLLPSIPTTLAPTKTPLPTAEPTTLQPTLSQPPTTLGEFLILCPEGYLDLTVELQETMVLCCASGNGSFQSLPPSFAFQQCEVATVVPKGVILLFLRTDAKPHETSFTLMDIVTNEILWDVYAGMTTEGEVLQADTEYWYEIAVDASSCYIFTMQDIGGDGLTASPDGVFELYYNGELTLLGHDFGSEEVSVVSDGCFA